MARYLLSVHSGPAAAHEPMTDERMRAGMAKIGELEREMKAAGAWVFSARLHDADTATVVRVSDGDVLTTDGPFVESKEHLAGFYVIEAADLDDALAWGAKVTALIGAPIEIRPFAAWADEPMG